MATGKGPSGALPRKGPYGEGPFPTKSFEKAYSGLLGLFGPLPPPRVPLGVGEWFGKAEGAPHSIGSSGGLASMEATME